MKTIYSREQEERAMLGWNVWACERVRGGAEFIDHSRNTIIWYEQLVSPQMSLVSRVKNVFLDFYCRSRCNSWVRHRMISYF